MRRLALLLTVAAGLAAPATAQAAPTLVQVGGCASPIHVAAPPRDRAPVRRRARGRREGRRRRRVQATPFAGPHGRGRHSAASAGCSRSPSRPTTRASGSPTSTSTGAGGELQVREHHALRRPGRRTAPPHRAGSCWRQAHTEAEQPQRRRRSRSGPTGCCGSRTGDGGGSNDQPARAGRRAHGLAARQDAADRPARASGRAPTPSRADNPFGTAVCLVRACATRCGSPSTAGPATC